MKTTLHRAGSRRGARAMTMAEMMVCVGLFTLVYAGLVSVNLFGLRQDELVNSKLGASDQSRLNFQLMLDEIRSGKNVQIGTGNYANFVPIGNGPQVGDTIQIWPSTNTNYYIYYYFLTNVSPNGSWLVRASLNNGALATNIVAKYLTNMYSALLTNSLATTNPLCFSAMSLNGTNWTILTMDPTNISTRSYTVDVLLQFYQYQYPMTMVGSNFLFDYYQIELSASRRAL